MPALATFTKRNQQDRAANDDCVNGGPRTRTKYDYDALGRRYSKTVGSLVTRYLLDGDEEIAEMDGANNVLRRFVTASAVDDRIADVEGSSTSPTPANHTYFHVNHQGSVIAMTDATGNATGCFNGTLCQRLSYDEYGNLSSGATSTGQPYRYTGRRYDPETGLYYYRARYYSPQLGRFLQTDPVGYKDDVDLYTYVGNDPLDKTDPSGKIAGVDDAAEAGVVLVGAAALYVAAETCTPGSACQKGAAAGLDWLGGKIRGLFSSPEKPADKPPSAPGDKPADSSRSRSNPLTGEPGSASETTTRDGKPKQTREYGDDGYPTRDVDHDHDHGQGQPHVHDWDRPADGSPPTHTDRQPGRAPAPGEVEQIRNKCLTPGQSGCGG